MLLVHKLKLKLWNLILNNILYLILVSWTTIQQNLFDLALKQLNGAIKFLYKNIIQFLSSITQILEDHSTIILNSKNLILDQLAAFVSILNLFINKLLELTYCVLKFQNLTLFFLSLVLNFLLQFDYNILKISNFLLFFFFVLTLNIVDSWEQFLDLVLVDFTGIVL